jgi:thymidylate synthase (FAD)
VAGQACYLSFGPKRTTNAGAAKYFENIKSSGHGSVLEHASFSFLFYGVSRSFTHELVRHRAGTAFSQTSQRYVDGSVLRFVERPEYQEAPDLHARFEAGIDGAAREYAERTDLLLAGQGAGAQLLSGEAKTDLRKKVQQCARSCLPNEAEAPIVFSANIRALRHTIEMRASAHAELEIREVFLRVFLCLCQAEPILFNDYAVERLPDGTHGVTTRHRKV